MIKKNNIAIAEDHLSVRQGIISMLSHENGSNILFDVEKVGSNRLLRDKKIGFEYSHLTKKSLSIRVLKEVAPLTQGY